MANARQDVSRETEAMFSHYLALLREWQTKMNLVAPSTLQDARQRHIEDSLQLIDFIPVDLRVKTWVDFGAGAGFPAMVIAIVSDYHIHMVESRAKKCAFLQHVADELGLSDRVTIHSERAEFMRAPKADIISARACAALPKLFDWGMGFAAQHTCWLLPKGRGVAAEVAAAQAEFTFEHRLFPSRTDADARIVAARRVRRIKGRESA